MSVLIGVIILILLIISFIPNYKAMKLAKSQGQKTTRFAIMVGIDAILIVLILVTLLLKIM
ncbi:hypothetical protein WL555_06270 [Staphylococcus warneri]|jgi:uncharacterized membrane protein (DUF485 family)|uniref:Uncharacterized protein n=1 Tax=Staphylococcus warneri TaxID=1292 RepID=A0A364US10_STAWA|nr:MULTISPECIES: hypothetical protein [Staphylococcus]MBJ7886145.1 hypothetical protein [Bacillaceae bacterium HSR45]MCC8989161.1 hypothetical protein [Staphylococcus sp.]MCR4456109.1 hypothetical protein [Aeromonas salmonicida]QAV30275.1 hypothetical protein SD1155_01270 [Sulfitobacter donghicola]CQA12858.1 Uncharacterised protein [Mycobacteroides abscessus]SKR75793.1 Uncharacterised protein [Mycobacteroides abscessus subsp. abscessus]